MTQVENVIVVVVDALRADRVGAVDGERGLTPNIDAIAEEGTAFDNTFTCSSNTDPSITSLLSGRYPLNTVYHHGKLVTDEEKRRVEALTPLPEILSNNGLKTVTVGQKLDRWHSRGFDHYREVDTETRLRSHLMDAARRVFDVVNSVSPSAGSRIRSAYNLSNPGMKPRVVMQDYDPTDLLSHLGSENFFGFVHLMDTHTPYLGTTEDFDELIETRDYPRESLDEFFAGRDVSDAQYERVANSLDELGLESPGELVALYDAAVRYSDRKIGDLVGELRRSGLWEDTALFVTADHGESLLEHGIYLDHHGLYDEVFRVPLVTNLGDGNDVPNLVQLIDIAPTVLDLLDLDGPQMDGESLVPLVRGDDGWEERPAAFAEEAYTERRVGIRTESWKYVRHVADETIEAERGSSLECGYCDTVHGSEQELYDLDADPLERDNALEDRPGVAEELDQLYEEFTSSLVEPSAGADAVHYQHEDEVLDRLEAIGYR